MRSRRSRAVLVGWYGQGNVGDELLMYTIARAIRRALPSHTLTILAGALRPWRSEVDAGFRPLPVITHHFYTPFGMAQLLSHLIRRDPGWISTLADTDVLVVGGGSLLHDRQPRNLIFWWNLLNCYKRFGARIVFYGVGIDEVRRPDSDRIRHRILALADGISVRDRNSAEVVTRTLGPARVALAADPVLNCPLVPQEFRDNELSKPAIVALNLRPLPTVTRTILVEQGIDLVRQLIHRYDADVEFVPLWEGDATIGASLLHHLPVPWRHRFRLVSFPPRTLAEHIALYARYHAAIGMRLHFCLLAFCTGLPVVGLGYDPKLSAFFDDTGMKPYFVEVARGQWWEWLGFSTDSVLELLEKAMREHPLTKQARSEALAALRARERSSQDVLEWVIGRQ